MSLFGSRNIEEIDINKEEEVVENQTPLIGGDKTDTTHISDNIVFEGKISGSGKISIRGTVKGEIKSLGTVLVDTIGTVEGPICGEDVIVAGKVIGNIMGTNQVKLESTGSIIGDVTTKSLVILSGGQFNGTSIMLKDSDESRNDDKADTDHLTGNDTSFDVDLSKTEK